MRSIHKRLFAIGSTVILALVGCVEGDDEATEPNEPSEMSDDALRRHCGDRRCSASRGETCSTCPTDCGRCPDAAAPPPPPPPPTEPVDAGSPPPPPPISSGNVVTASSCALSAVQSAISAAQQGDTVRVPAGTCSWAGGLSFSGVRLVGAGSSASGTVITAGRVSVNKHATQYTRLSGFRFTGTDAHIVTGGPSASGKPYIIDNNYVRSDVSGLAVHLGANGGLLHHNQFTAVTWTNADTFNIQTGEDWSQAPTFGVADTTGERNIYFEDNTFTNLAEAAPDGDVGSRIVIRHNDYIDAGITFHGGQPTDSSPNGGTRHFEIYNNNFKRVSNAIPINKWIWVRGSSGIIANNVMDRAESPDGSSYPNKNEIRLTVGCPTAYPVQHQVGQSNISPENPPSHPLAIFGNTGAGTTDANFISVAGSDTAGPPCATPATYIQKGRDYVLSNTWGWSPYVYPHPLQSVQ